MAHSNDFQEDLFFENNVNSVKKPIPVLRQQQSEQLIPQILIEHVKNRDFTIQLFDVSAENLKNLKNIKQNSQMSSHNKGSLVFQNEEEVSK